MFITISVPRGSGDARRDRSGGGGTPCGARPEELRRGGPAVLLKRDMGELERLSVQNTDFPRTLSLLRKEKGVSQKDAAAELGVSQALLSHYERGLREPGLRFVALAADYYGVSADFLLGRTQSRDGSDVDPTEYFDASAASDNRLRGSAAAMFSKKVLSNALSVLFDIVGRTGSQAMLNGCYNILSSTVYTLFREIYERAGSEPERFFALSERESRRMISAGTQVSMNGFEAELDRREALLDPLSHDILVRSFPQTANSLMSVIHAAESAAAGVRDAVEAVEE